MQYKQKRDFIDKDQRCHIESKEEMLWTLMDRTKNWRPIGNSESSISLRLLFLLLFLSLYAPLFYCTLAFCGHSGPMRLNAKPFYSGTQKSLRKTWIIPLGSSTWLWTINRGHRAGGQAALTAKLRMDPGEAAPKEPPHGDSTNITMF